MIGNQIKFLRKKYKLSQTNFGKRVGASLKSIQRWESDHNIPNNRLIMICQTFGIDEHWLRTGEGEMYGSTVQINHDSSGIVQQIGGTFNNNGNIGTQNINTTSDGIATPEDIREIIDLLQYVKRDDMDKLKKHLYRLKRRWGEDNEIFGENNT